MTDIILPTPGGDEGTWGAPLNTAIGVVRDAADAAQADADAAEDLAQEALDVAYGVTAGSELFVKSVIWNGTDYPAQTPTAPAGIYIRHFYGPEPYAGATWPGVLDLYTVVEWE